MKREKFKKIIKLRSFWKIDKRKGDYKLLNGTQLSEYVEMLVRSQMKIDSLGISIDGDLYDCGGGEVDNKEKRIADYVLFIPFQENEVCSFIDMEQRIMDLVSEIIY